MGLNCFSFEVSKDEYNDKVKEMKDKYSSYGKEDIELEMKKLDVEIKFLASPYSNMSYTLGSFIFGLMINNCGFEKLYIIIILIVFMIVLVALFEYKNSKVKEVYIAQQVLKELGVEK